VKNVQEKIDQADTLLGDGEARGALNLLKSISEDSLNGAPQETQYKYLEVLGEAYSENDMEKEAIECFERALRIQTSSKDVPFLYYNLGFAYSQLNDNKRAISFLEESVRLENRHEYLLNPLSHLATCYREEGQYAKALSINQRIIQEFYPPKGKLEAERVEMAYAGLVVCYLQLGNDEEAERFFEKLIDDPNVEEGTLSGVYGACGNYCLEQNDFEKAVQFYTKAIDYAKKASNNDLITHWKKWLLEAKEKSM